MPKPTSTKFQPRGVSKMDEGYSGATLLRPGLEALRDLAAAGQVEAVLIYSPDRLGRKCAYLTSSTASINRGNNVLPELDLDWNF
jgi:DNA invertase Pin-like site-specific DNA recombinase